MEDRGWREALFCHFPSSILHPSLLRMTFPPPSAKQARWLWISLTALAIGILVFLLGGLLWAVGRLLQTLASVLLPLAIAGIIAYLLDPLVNFFERRKIPRVRAILLVFFLVLSFVFIFVST